MSDFITLENILKIVNEFKWFDHLYLPENDVWDTTTKGLVLDPDDIEVADGDIPKLAKNNGLMSGSFDLMFQTMDEGFISPRPCQKQTGICDFFRKSLFALLLATRSGLRVVLCTLHLYYRNNSFLFIVVAVGKLVAIGPIEVNALYLAKLIFCSYG